MKLKELLYYSFTYLNNLYSNFILRIHIFIELERITLDILLFHQSVLEIKQWFQLKLVITRGKNMG